MAIKKDYVMEKRKIFLMDILIALLAVCLLFATWKLLRPDPPLELPLTQEAAQKNGEKLLRKSFPILFRQETEGHKLDMTTKVVDKGDFWEVYNYHEPHLIETKDGRKILPGYATVTVVFEKSTGNGVEVGF